MTAGTPSQTPGTLAADALAGSGGPGDRAPGLVEVPVLADRLGGVWVLPGCRALTPGRDLIESVVLDEQQRTAVASAAQSAAASGRGTQASTWALGAGAEPVATHNELDGWALAAQLAGVDLGVDPSIGARMDRTRPAPAMPTGYPSGDSTAVDSTAAGCHALEARLRAHGAAPGARLLHLRLPHGPESPSWRPARSAPRSAPGSSCASSPRESTAPPRRRDCAAPSPSAPWSSTARPPTAAPCSACSPPPPPPPPLQSKPT